MNRIIKKIALMMVLVMLCSTLFGCMSGAGGDGSNGSNGTGDKTILDDLLSVIDDIGNINDTGWSDTTTGSDNTGTNSSDASTGGGMDIVSSLFDAFFGGSSSDYGWGESSYSGGYDNLIGDSSNTTASYSDVDAVPAGNGKTTVLVYLLGSNLESESGCGTMDIAEMCGAGIGDNVNVIIEAGGAKKWQNSVITASKLGRYKVEGENLVTLDLLPKTSMVEKSTVTDFIKWGVKNYPADNYDIIFWNHGGGTLAGFGMDELFSGDLSIADIASAIKDSGVHFNFVGFDACLMGTIEVAYSLAPYADYLIASEEEEPGYGWYHTGYLKALNKNPGIDMETFAKILVDDFIADNKGDSTTLSVIKLSKIQELYATLCEFFANGKKAISNGSYKAVSSARSKTKAFGDGNYDQIDIIDFCKKSGIEGADKVIAAVEDAIVYHNTNIKNANGLAMYFPYQYPSYYKKMLQMTKGFGMTDSDYNGFFNAFLSVKSSGYTSRTAKPAEVLTDYRSIKPDQTFENESWYERDVVEKTDEAPIEVNEEGLINIVQNGDYYIPNLTAEDYEKITYYDYSVFVELDEEDGGGYVDMGYDNSPYYDENDNFAIWFDNAWVAINGTVVPYYVKAEVENDDGTWYSYGNVYALYTSVRTGETIPVEIVLQWDSEHDGGYVKGFHDTPEDENTPTVAERNLRNFVKGDIIQIVCDHYDDDGVFESEHTWGTPITVENTLEVTYEIIEETVVDVFGHMKDVYGNEYWTDYVRFVPDEE